MEESPKNIIMVFHSYPKKPCIDGLMAAILAIRKYEHCKIKLVPYWRTDESFQRLKKTVESVAMENTLIYYLDCAPDLDQEVNYLLTIIKDICIVVHDHHVLKEATPMRQLIGKEGFDYEINLENCAAQMMYNDLNEVEKEHVKKYEDLLTLVQFSDYEGMKPQLSRKQESVKIAKAAFDKASDFKCKQNLQKIMELDMHLYYIVDNILTGSEDWEFLYNKDLTDDEIFDFFRKQEEVYLQNAVSTVAGENPLVYNEDKTKKYLHLLQDMEKSLKTGTVLKSRPISSKKADVYICQMDMFQYGRSLEPYVKNKLKNMGASFAILINKPTQNIKKELSYYLSLRCVDVDEFDCRDLAKFVMDVSGSKIGGGHPWASGATLNEKQYQAFVQKEIKLNYN